MNKTLTFFHGSFDPLLIGTCIRSGGAQSFVASTDEELEAVFEAARPAECIPRSEAVFLASDPEDIDALGGYTEHVYEVILSPGEAASAHDLAWYSEAQISLEDDDMAGAAGHAARYWSGERFPDAGQGILEYLVRSALVVRELVDEPCPGLR